MISELYFIKGILRVKKVFLGMLVLLGQLLFTGTAEAQSHVGDYYCGECTEFGGVGQPYTPEVRTFIGYRVNRDLGESGWLEDGNPRTVTICNGTVCVTYTYHKSGVHMQITPEVEDNHEQDEYENPEDAPADGSTGSGGGGSGSGPPPTGGTGAPGCIYGCPDGPGGVVVGDVENL